MVFPRNIWRSYYLGIYKILCADVYLNASCRAGNAHISTIWGLTAQKRPCNPRENSAGHRGHFQRFIEGYGIYRPRVPGTRAPLIQPRACGTMPTSARQDAHRNQERTCAEPHRHPHGEMKCTCCCEHIEQRDGHAEAGRALTAATRMQRHTDPRADGGALIACQPAGRAARQSRNASARPSCHIYDARGSSP